MNATGVVTFNSRSGTSRFPAERGSSRCDCSIVFRACSMISRACSLCTRDSSQVCLAFCRARIPGIWNIRAPLSSCGIGTGRLYRREWLDFRLSKVTIPAAQEPCCLFAFPEPNAEPSNGTPSLRTRNSFSGTTNSAEPLKKVCSDLENVDSECLNGFNCGTEIAGIFRFPTVTNHSRFLTRGSLRLYAC